MTQDSFLIQTRDLQAEIGEAFIQGRIRGIPAPAVLIETHVNRIYLAGDKAYKLKRAIQLPFVDFRTLDQRRKACETELAINQALGSPFYLQVAPIIRNARGFALGGEGDVVDWVVVMQRFAAGARFDELAEHGALDVAAVEAATSMIVRMHATAAPTMRQGHAADYRQIIRSLRRTEQAAAAGQGLTMADPDLYDQLDAELARLDPLIEERRAAGKVRRLHGDLHLANLCMYEGAPTAFDALEFDARMATTDVLYDIAFLLMDLEKRGLKRHANAAMNRYWDEAGEGESGLALLPFFMALRAVVRMVVAVQAEALSEAFRYRELAVQLLAHARPVAMAIGGLSGSGKSTLAKAVAPFLPGPAGARILRSDVLRKRAAGFGLTQRPDRYCYDATRRAEIYRDLVARAAIARRMGASVIADATFQLADARATLDAGLPDCRKIWLDSPLDLRIARVSARRDDPSDADAGVASRQALEQSLDGSWRRLESCMPVNRLADLVLRETK